MKRIRLSAHAVSYIDRRGFTVAEVEEAIRTYEWQSAELGRLKCQMNFPMAGSGTARFTTQNRSVRYLLTNPQKLLWLQFIHIIFEQRGGMIMKICYDQEVDALSIIFRETTVTTRSLAEGIAGEYDSDGRLAGIELLDAVKRFGDADTLRQVILEGIGPTVPAR